MNLSMKSVLECERKQLAKWNRFQLPHSYKKAGLVVVLLSFLSLIVNKLTLDSETLRAIAKYGMLVGMLIISLSKAKIEDELVVQLRMQSYRFAFIIGVVFSLIQPFLNYLVDSFFDANGAVLKPNGDFQILWILLSVQVLYFEVLKRYQ